MPSAPRLLVVSHACVLAVNQGVYASMANLGRDVALVVPDRWRDDYAAGFGARSAPGLEGKVTPVRVVGRGRPQRHAYLARAARVLRAHRPDAVLVEEEPFSLAALQWTRAARRLAIPYGVQVAETIGRPMPRVVERWRTTVLRHASFVVARSPSAARLARTWGASGEVAVVPHSVAPVPARATPDGVSTVAFVGRLVEAKGIGDLLEATRRLEGRVRLVVAGDGPMRDAVARAGPHVELLGPVPHDRVGEVYARAHVTCVPSRTTPTWTEQFGRVVIESLVRGVPVVACSTGELPWVLEVTGGGTLVPERDPGSLAAALGKMAEDRAAAEQLGLAGRAGVLAAFSDDAVAATIGRLVDALRTA